MKLINWVTRGFGLLIAALALYAIFETERGGQQLRGLSNKNGVLAFAVGCAAIAIWIARKIYVEMKKRKYPDFELTRLAVQFLRQNHILFGWLTLIAATAHGIYYLVVKTDRAYEVYTGWSAWSALFVLAVLGIWFEKRLADRKKVKTTRVYHIGFAFLFAAGAILHLL